jgi:hypothetical protein
MTRSPSALIFPIARCAVVAAVVAVVIVDAFSALPTPTTPTPTTFPTTTPTTTPPTTTATTPFGRHTRFVYRTSSVRRSGIASSSPPSSSTTSSAATRKRRRVVPPTARISILDPIGNGTFGMVHHARDDETGMMLVAKRSRAIIDDDDDDDDARRKRNGAADSYLDVEAYVNTVLCPSPSEGGGHDAFGGRGHQRHSRHVAPYLGEYYSDEKDGGTTYLVWRASGERTLEDYIRTTEGGGGEGWMRLADDLGLLGGDDDAASGGGGRSGDATTDDDDRRRILLRNRLAAEILRQILEGLAYGHSCGIVHRDIKVSKKREAHTHQLYSRISFSAALRAQLLLPRSLPPNTKNARH